MNGHQQYLEAPYVEGDRLNAWREECRICGEEACKYQESDAGGVSQYVGRHDPCCTEYGSPDECLEAERVDALLHEAGL